MISQVLLGVLAIAATLAGIYGARLLEGGSPGAPAAEALTVIKLDPMSVPIIRAGVVQGYAVVRVVLAVREAEAKLDRNILLTYGNESVLRAVYEDETIDFATLKPTQLPDLTERIAAYANARLGRHAVEKAVIEGLNFVTKGEERKANAR